jgi:hypothetical protein
MTPESVKELKEFLQFSEDLKNLREGLYYLVWSYLEENLDTGVHPRINGIFLMDFNHLLEVLTLLDTEK